MFHFIKNRIGLFENNYFSQNSEVCVCFVHIYKRLFIFEVDVEVLQFMSVNVEFLAATV